MAAKVATLVPRPTKLFCVTLLALLAAAGTVALAIAFSCLNILAKRTAWRTTLENARVPMAVLVSIGRSNVVFSMPIILQSKLVR